MQLPSVVECDAQVILTKLVKQGALSERLIDARKIIEDYYVLVVQDANKAGGSKVGGMVGGAVAIGAITYTGGVSTIVNPIISSLAAMTGAKLTQWLLPEQGSLTGLVLAFHKAWPEGGALAKGSVVDSAISAMRDALERLKRSVTDYKKRTDVSPDVMQTLYGVGAGAGIACCGSCVFSSCFGPMLSSSMPLIGVAFVLAQGETSKKMTGDCLMGEMLITTDQISVEQCPRLSSKNAQSCIIVVIRDLNNPANAVIAHMDIGVASYLQTAIQTAVDRLRDAGSSAQNLHVELFGGINNGTFESTDITSGPICFEAKSLGVLEKNIVYQHCPSGQWNECTRAPDYYAIDVSYDRLTGVATPTITLEETYLEQVSRDGLAAFGEVSSDKERMNRFVERMSFMPRIAWHNRAINIIEVTAPLIKARAETGLRKRF